MLKYAIDELLEKVNNRYELVQIIIKRIKDLEERKKSDPLFLYDVDIESFAMQELREGKLSVRGGGEEA